MKVFYEGETLTADALNAALKEAANDLIEEALKHINNGEIFIDGTWYQQSGTMAYPAGAFTTATNGVYYRTAYVNRPYTAPPGWKFNYSIQQTNGLTFLSTGESTTKSTTDTLRILQIGSSGATLGTYIAWTLIREG